MKNKTHTDSVETKTPGFATLLREPLGKRHFEDMDGKRKTVLNLNDWHCVRITSQSVFIFSLAQQPNTGQGRHIFKLSSSHTVIHHSR